MTIAQVRSITHGISPHPVPLPMGEGTPELALRVIQGFLLPWGEGQDEGRSVRNFAAYPAITPEAA
jgi:hypothetical protein